jgi:Abortive infection alpha
VSNENGKPDDGAFLSPLDRDTAPGLARLAVGAWWRTSLWAAQAAARGTRRLADAARSGESAAALVDDTRREVATAGRQLLGISESTSGERRGRAVADYDDEPLRERWDDLVDLSTEMEVEVDGHPAFAGILRELHPDEARILRLLYTAGPQAAVDVRNWRPLGIGSHVVAPGLNMIGQHAGCLMVERVPVYLSNLFRLGLIWFSRDPVGEIGPYQVLEAQPEVRQALKSAGHGTTVRRSVRLTPFGEQFCLACLPADTREFEAVGAPKTRAIDEVPPPNEEPEPGIG